MLPHLRAVRHRPAALGGWGFKLRYCDPCPSAASAQTTILPTARTTLRWRLHGPAAGLGDVHRRYFFYPDLSTWASGHPVDRVLHSVRLLRWGALLTT